MISLQDFLSRLQKVERHGDQYMACCPAHDDRKASLAVRMGDKKIVCQCLAGCAYEDIIAAMGLSWKDVIKPEYLREYDGRPAPGKSRRRRSGTPSAEDRKGSSGKPESPSATPSETTKKSPADLRFLRVGGQYAHRKGGELVQERITAEYTYEDADGNPVLKVFRTEGKQFPTVHHDADGWFWGDGDRKDLLYRLPQVLAAIRKGERIHIVEGEKDVGTMEAMGLTATCNKGGAGKWPEGLTESLKGADVSIIPDNDEPGRKHALLAAKSLEGTARSVQILDLRKIDGVELPEKGDVSDAFQQIGGSRLREELARLVRASPVLSRVVSDSDYAAFFDLIHGAKVENGHILGMKNNEYYPLCNFVALPVEQVLLDDGLTEPRYQLTIMGWSAKGYAMKTLRVGLDEFNQMDWPAMRWGLDAIIQEGSTTKGKLRRIIQEAGSRAAVSKTMYAHTGWRKIAGRWCFLHGGGAIGADGVSTRLDFGFGRFDLSGLRSGPWMELPPEERRRNCENAMVRLLGISGLRIGVPLVGFMFLAPLRHWLERRGHRPSFIPFLFGDTGCGKSTMASLAMQCFGYDFGYESAQPASFADTWAALSLKLFTLKDLPLLIDDYHPESDAKRAAAMAGIAEQVSRIAGDGMNRSRMRSDATAQEDKPARGLCLETGEEVPRISPSGIARLYTVEIRYGEVPIPASYRLAGKAPDEGKVKELQELTKAARDGALNEVMRGYIEWLAAQAEELPELLEARLDRLQAQALERMDGAHPRLPTAVAYLMLGVEMMMDYLSQPGGLMYQVDKERIREQCWEAVARNGREQILEMEREKPAELFITTVRELLDGGAAVIQPIDKPTAAAPRDLIGYSDELYYYLNPGETFRKVQKSLQEQGSRFPLGKNQLFRTLAGEKKIVPAPNGSNVRQVKRGIVHAWMLWVPRYVIDGLTEVDVDPDDLPFDPPKEPKQTRMEEGETTT